MEHVHLERERYCDNLKKELCRKHGIALLEVPYTVESQELTEWIYQAIQERSDVQQLPAKMQDFRELQPTAWVESEHYSIKDLRAHAKAKEGGCLSEIYLGSRDKHRWRCAEGHEWEATWDSVHKIVGVRSAVGILSSILCRN